MLGYCHTTSTFYNTINIDCVTLCSLTFQLTNYDRSTYKWTQLTNLSTTVPNLQTYALVLFGFHRTITDDMNWRSGLHIMNYWTGKHDQRPQNRLLCIVYVPTFTKPNKNMIQISVMNFSCFTNCYVKNVKFLNDKSLWCVQIVKKII